LADIGPTITDISGTGAVRKRSTGITGLNLLLDGGFPQGTSILVYGSATSGIELMARQFVQVQGEEGSYLINDGEAVPGMTDVSDRHPEMYLPELIGSRIAVDSLSTILLKFGLDVSLKFMRIACDAVRARGANVMFILYTGIHTPVEMTRLMRAADICIELFSGLNMNEIERTLIVHKIAGARVPQRALPFIITEAGIEASTTSRVV
jgi:KaiC/GvpD/RAD55 family RecA-like ATPase